MTERQEITKRYNVVAINLSFPEQSLFLKGNWDGIEENIPLLDVKPNEHVIKGLVLPPLIIDNIDHDDEIVIRDYVHECRFLYMSAKVRSNITVGSTNIYSNELTKLINDMSMNEESIEVPVYFAIRKDLKKRISDVNKRTLQKKPPPKEEPKKIPSISLEEVVEIYDQFCVHVDDTTKELHSLDPMKITLQTFTDIANKMLDHIPVIMIHTKERLEKLIKTNTEPTDEESDTKPSATEGKAQSDQDEETDDNSDNFPDDVQDQSRFAFKTGLEESVPKFYRPTIEKEAMQALADTIKKSEFGKLKGVRILTTPIEIILAYATYLIAMIGETTVTNIKVNKTSDWFHIKEKHHKEYIHAFYASYTNYKNTVHPGTSYRKEYINNGLIAAMTLMISTAIGVSDETFMKAVDPTNWKKKVYPFISGRRKLTRAERDTSNLIATGKFLNRQSKGVIPPSIIDFFDHIYPLRNLKKDELEAPVDTFVNVPEESDTQDERQTNTFLDIVEGKQGTRKSKKPVDTRTSTRTPTKRMKVTGKTPPEVTGKTPPGTTTLKPLYGRVHPTRKGKKNEEIEIIDKTPESTDDEKVHEDVVTNPRHQTKVGNTIDKTKVARRTSTSITRANETDTYNENEFRFDSPGTTMRIEGSNMIFTTKDGKTLIAPRIGVIPSSYELPPEVAQIEGIAANYLTTLHPNTIPAIEQIGNTESEEQKTTEPIDTNSLVTPTRHKRVSYKAVLETNVDTLQVQERQSNISIQSEHESQGTSTETVIETAITDENVNDKDIEGDGNTTETENEK
jgi:predicted transcriptional regulator